LGDSSGGTERPAPARPPPVRRDLPARLTSFIGRGRELAELERLLTENRLVTVVGPGGAGKTSLALSTAVRTEVDVDTGFVELAGVTDPEMVAEQLAVGLGLEAGPNGESAQRLLLTHFRDRRAVLVVDNCEHVLDGAAGIVGDLLARCPGVSVIATSRERLGVPGERLLNLSGLGPADSVRLFGDRAAELGVDCRADDPAISVICERLDGMPLAIELAAALTPTLEPADIAGRLDDRFTLLTRGARTALPRHQTLRAAIGWSYDLLDDPDASLFRCLGLIRASWDIGLAAAVAGVDESTAIGQVAALVDRSVVERVGGGRFRMLDTLRAFALERLAEAAELGEATDRFVSYVEALATQAEPDLRTARQMVWAERLNPERDNLRHAVELALDTGQVDRALYLCGTLGYFWFTQALVEEELRLVKRALAVRGTDRLARARAIQTHLMLVFIQAVGRDPELNDLADEMVESELELGGPPHTVWALALRGIAQSRSGNAEIGLAALDEALAAALETKDTWAEGLIRAFAAAARVFGSKEMMRPQGLDPAAECFRASGDRWMLAFTLGMQSTVHRQLGQYPVAMAILDEALQLAREVGSRWIEANTLVEVGNLHALMGDHQEAAAVHDRAEPVAAAVGAPGLLGHLANSRGLNARARGDLEAALAHHARAMRIYRSAGGQGGEALALDASGYALQELGRSEEAQECHRQAFELGLAGYDVLAMALSIEGLAGVASAIGDPTEAALMLGAADRLRTSVGVPLAGGERSSVDRSERILRERLGDGRFEETMERGRMLEDADVVGMIRAG